MPRLRLTLLALSLLILALAALAGRAGSAGAVSELGYVWRLQFPFDDSFDGILTIQTGPVKNGVLQSVEQTSTTAVPCERVGPVNLIAGAAVFNGGYLRCTLDLAVALQANHGLGAPATESYNRMTMSTRLASTGTSLAPIVTHRDLAYQIDFDGGDNVVMHQTLATKGGGALSQAAFGGMFGGDRRTYGFVYQCAPNAALCAAGHSAGAAVSGGPVAGGPVSFRTGTATLLIGGDGASTFLGGIDDLIIDPGNGI
jgi:hypothetical protein